MTFLSRILALFPTIAILLDLAAVGWFCARPSFWSAIAIPLAVYGFPVIIYRLHQWRYPIESGISYLQTDTYSPWWGSHQMQVIFIAMPALESILRLVPGFFSAWLRLWGAKVGTQVYWTPGLEIADRGLLEVGDRVVFGHQVELYAHVIKPKKNDLMLYVKPIIIGDDAFIGAASRISAGTVIANGTYVPAKTDVHPNSTLDHSSVAARESQ
ncbi:MAG: hypothetical protein WBA57_25405 [Elainellaceae cyanobacterium]